MLHRGCYITHSETITLQWCSVVLALQNYLFTMKVVVPTIPILYSITLKLSYKELRLFWWQTDGKILITKIASKHFDTSDILYFQMHVNSYRSIEWYTVYAILINVAQQTIAILSNGFKTYSNLCVFIFILICSVNSKCKVCFIILLKWCFIRCSVFQKLFIKLRNFKYTTGRIL